MGEVSIVGMIKNINILKKELLLLVTAILFFIQPTIIFAQTVTLNVSGPNNVALTGYRWLIEEDVNQQTIPGQTCYAGNYEGCMSFEFHKSYMPVVAEGSALDPLPNLDPSKTYHITVLPDSAGSPSGYTLGGAKIQPGQLSANIVVNQLSLPTAQIRVFVHQDDLPINNTPDTGEPGLAGFSILLEDAGGRYGAAGQQIVNDVYGNPLGTTYNPDGSIVATGSGVILTDANGVAIIKNLAPAKYGIQAVPPAGSTWLQTATIEGKKIVDAWVKANEPAYFAEFGPPGPHVFIGFVKPFVDSAKLSGGATISGKVTSTHNSRPPEFTFHSGAPVPACVVGLNDLSVGLGKGIFTAECDADSNFSIPNVPDGNYQLVMWDKNLDYIFASKGVTVANGQCDGGNCALGNVPIFSWFSRLEQYVFNDINENGLWDDGERGMPEQATAIRWRDGTIYQEFPTDLGGAAPYDEVFPFFSWLVAEVGFDRFKATGATIVVDNGGAINAADPWSLGGVLNPQPQSENAGAPYRTETGPVLTQAFQGFLGQTNAIMWGKTRYPFGENGGISGIVYYAITRAEDNPQYAAAEPWEPGIPRIQVALYKDANRDRIVDDLNADGCATVADVDNYPFNNFPGTEDFDYPALDPLNACAPIAGTENGIKDLGDAVQVTYTDSWDDALPTGCQGSQYIADGVYPTDCFDGLRNFNQVRPGVFDGGYAFNDITAGYYIVGTGDHPVYKTLKEEDRNVDFGDTYAVPALLPPICVGDDHIVPDSYSLFEGVPADAGLTKPVCDRKHIRLSNGRNAAADFYMFTEVPVAGHIVGFILDNVSNEFDPNSPTFGEKYSPPNLPVSIRDWTGREISRTYSDRFGRFNALVPSLILQTCRHQVVCHRTC